MIPGKYPSRVKTTLINRSPPQPLSRKTPRGGSKTARMILQISLVVNGISNNYLFKQTNSSSSRRSRSSNRSPQLQRVVAVVVVG